MNRKEKSLSANCPQKTGTVILNQNNYFLCNVKLQKQPFGGVLSENHF